MIEGNRRDPRQDKKTSCAYVAGKVKYLKRSCRWRKNIKIGDKVHSLLEKLVKKWTSLFVVVNKDEKNVTLNNEYCT